jgi:hypothetical protein
MNENQVSTVCSTSFASFLLSSFRLSVSFLMLGKRKLEEEDQDQDQPRKKQRPNEPEVAEIAGNNNGIDCPNEVRFCSAQPISITSDLSPFCSCLAAADRRTFAITAD